MSEHSFSNQSHSESMQGKVLAGRVAKFSTATLISRILGYVRDASVAHFFGGTYLTDVFYTAFRTSNLFRRLLGEGALSSAFIPVFSKSLKNDSKEEVQRFLNALFTSLFLIVLVLTVAGIVFAPWITRWIAPGFLKFPEKFEMTVHLTRWIFPFFFFISLAALVTGILNSLKRFFVPAVAPAMLSVAEIVYLFGLMRHFSPEDQIIGLAISVAVGGALHLMVQLPSLIREKYVLRFRWEWKHPHSVQVGKLMGPAVVGLSVDQVNAFVNTICATFLVEGSVTALYNSNRLMQLPLALFGIAIATVALPVLSDHSAENNFKKMGKTVDESLRMVFYIVTPATVGLIMLAVPIVSLLFEHGEFTSFSTQLTAKALVGYSLGLVAYSSVRILANSFYALQEPRIPVKIAAVCMTINVVLNILLMRPFGVGGLAAATAISSWINAIWLFFLMRKRLGRDGIDSKGLAGTALKTFLSSAVMASFLWWFIHHVPDLGRFFQVLIGVAAGALVFILSSKLLKMKEQKSILYMVGMRGNIED